MYHESDLLRDLIWVSMFDWFEINKNIIDVSKADPPELLTKLPYFLPFNVL